MFYGCKYNSESVRRKNGYVSESEVHRFCVLYISILLGAAQSFKLQEL